MSFEEPNLAKAMQRNGIDLVISSLTETPAVIR